jgi:hypothetical protein
MCSAGSYSTTRTEGGVCPACAYAATAAAEAEAVRLHNEMFSRIRASVVKPLPHKKRLARGGPSADKNGEPSKEEK